MSSGVLRGSTYPPPVPPFLLKCVRGSLDASFSSSVHSRSHSSSVYTSPDWHKGKPGQEVGRPCQPDLPPLTPPRHSHSGPCGLVQAPGAPGVGHI